MAKKTTTSKLVQCFDCAKSELMQWGNDPVIAACAAKGGDKDVARSARYCSMYVKDISDKPIKKMIQ